jgi:hypothetical protein
MFNTHIKANLLLISLIFSLSACQFFQDNQKENAIARVGEKYLYLEDIDGLANADTEDSAQIVESYIDKWVREQLLMQKALQNLPESEVNFEKQLDNYRRSLIIYAYENQLLRQKLDTNISEDQIEVYYQNNQENFELREVILQMRMVMVRNSAPNQDSVKYWLFNRDSTELFNLVDYCTSFSEKCALDTSEWVSLNTLSTYLPKKQLKFEDLKTGANVFSDSLNTLYIDLFQIGLRGQRAPVSYVSDQIKAIIKNQRRLKLLEDVRKQIFEEANLKNRYEVYR